MRGFNCATVLRNFSDVYSIIYKRMKDVTNGIKHLREHQNYPASKEDLVMACSNLADFSDEDKKWFAEHIPNGSYASADDVIKAPGWNSEGAMSQG